MMRIVLLSKSALPSEMAHGRAMTKMCEAFAQCDAHVELWFPRQTDRELASYDLFQFYDISRPFRVRELGRMERLPRAVAWRVDAIFNDPYRWGKYAAALGWLHGADLFFTRSIELAYWLTRFRLPTVYELHQPLTGAGSRLLLEIAMNVRLLGVVTLTDLLKQHVIARGVPPSKVLVKPSGVDLARFAPTRPRSECRHRLGLPLDAPIVGYIGRFKMWDANGRRDVEKGIRMLTMAFQRVGRIGDKAPFLLCVGGPRELIPEYMRLARELGLTDERCLYRDRVPPAEAPLWIQACDVVTLPWADAEFGTESLSPLKMFEYMAAKVPIVATSIPAFRERLHHRENAWLVEPDDLDGFATGLRTLLLDKDLRERLARRAYEDVAKYTWRERAAAICRFAGLAS